VILAKMFLQKNMLVPGPHSRWSKQSPLTLRTTHEASDATSGSAVAIASCTSSSISFIVSSSSTLSTEGAASVARVVGRVVVGRVVVARVVVARVVGALVVITARYN